MKPRKRLSAHECLKRAKTDLFSNDILDIGGATQTEKTALWGEIANRKSSITIMAEALQSQKSAHLSKTILQKTAPQHNVADDNSSPSIRMRGSFEVKRSQILKMMAILKVFWEKKMVRAINGMSNH